MVAMTNQTEIGCDPTSRSGGATASACALANTSPSLRHDMRLRPGNKRAEPEEVSKEDVTGRKAAKGSCHCCGGMLKRNPDFAKLCGTCGARFHAYDCGNRRGEAGFRDFTQCPRVSAPTPIESAFPRDPAPAGSKGRDPEVSNKSTSGYFFLVSPISL